MYVLNYFIFLTRVHYLDGDYQQKKVFEGDREREQKILIGSIKYENMALITEHENDWINASFTFGAAMPM